MISNRFCAVGLLAIIGTVISNVAGRQACLDLQTQTVYYAQLSTNIQRKDLAIDVAINCCPNNQCCSPGIFESNYVLQFNGKCLPQSLIDRGEQAISCEDNKAKNLPSHQRKATLTGVRNGYEMRCLYANQEDETFDERIVVNVKVLPQLISFKQEVVDEPERGLLLTCVAALGTYTKDAVLMSFLNYTSGEPSGPIGTTKWDEQITKELTGSEKETADYLKRELNLTVPYSLELKHFIPDSVVYWRNLSIGCQLKLARHIDRADRIEFDTSDEEKKVKVINERNLETLPKVQLVFDENSKRLNCRAWSYPKATDMKWTYAPGRGENFTEIPIANVSALNKDAITDWHSSYYFGPFDPKSVYRCIITNAVGASTGEIEVSPTTTSTTTTTVTTATNVVEDVTDNELWEGPPDPLESQFPFYWVIVVVGILIIFAVAVAVILHLRKRAGSEYKSGKRDGTGDEEQQRLQDANAAGASSNEAAEVKVSSPAKTDPQPVA